ncbi:hypothetical protein ACFXJO_35410 [Streptomyces lavendulae]|uniref:hypothetical protein n=1 Tax=Streptomyces TaxID=1883 RepID=UPI00247632C1|nr:hypothetical protein [Streptomyces sp. SPB4]
MPPSTLPTPSGRAGTGVLVPGKRADFIVDGNPLTELDALRRFRHVFTAGRPVARPGSHR